MIDVNMMAPHEILQSIVKKARAKRLAQNLTQRSLSERSKVSYGVLKKFELTGKISLESLLKLAVVLGSLNDFQHLFDFNKYEEATSLDELMKDVSKKRGRK